MSQKMKEKQAKAVCDQEAVNIDATNKNLITNNGNSSNSVITSKTFCTLQ